MPLLSAGAAGSADVGSPFAGPGSSLAAPLDGARLIHPAPVGARRRSYDLASGVLGAGALFSLPMFFLAARPRRPLVALRLGASADRSSDLALRAFVVAASLAVGLVLVSVGP